MRHFKLTCEKKLQRDMSDIHFLFRFRDLVAATIQEHQNVITNRGWCWWGWWKRPAEDGRSDIWDELAHQTNNGTPVHVGLFDSGSGNVYRATITQVIKPNLENTIKVPAAEAEHVPAYYRESPFSRAWMKITQIDSSPVAFFANYSFAEAPKLPNYTNATLRQFVNKRVANPDELRGMDTTIWRVRPSLASDPAGPILLSVNALAEPVSTELVRCKSNTILHLTDLHFATGANRSQHVWRYDKDTGTRHTMVEAITSAIANQKIGTVIISGDFTFIGSPEEYDEARTSILHLLGILDLSPDHLVIVPGNHDIQWTTDAVYDHNSQVTQAPPAARHNYEDFYRQLLRHDPNRHLSMGRRFGLPCGLTLEVCAVNSSSLETGRNFLAGMGRTDEAALVEVAGQLGWTDNPKTMALRLLVVHHHLALTEDLEPAAGYGQGYGLAVDAVRIQRFAANKGVHLALHGHKHRAFIWRSTVYELPEHTQTNYKLGELSIVGGGSAGSRDTEGASNYFNLVTVEPAGKLNVKIFRSRDQGGFGPMQEWEAGLRVSNETNGLQLADWEKVR
ncbi:metallophosphoesterase family protein [Bradyrhizobium japonicum]|uniref:metallophosphoesterase family protein n=1 Tax=Bradyrhizobium japonicum TaxID=375 RepID=UPI001E47D8DA|nr:metallophosphoesterase [Bradyrhizobium japonicum]MCD9817683.1 metallophosphoesterase [Bradyrhizobium japonicum]MEB2672474.1 metallophosphoesterase [Bradyrhizobium japonicum]WRI91735.1 metallophosphoesterase [Bradyrhizobium japonicum]